MLVDYGFRLPSALDNRPLRFDEFLEKVPQLVFVSATPGQFELANSVNVAEQIIRPTGLIDPEVEVRPTEGQIDDLMNEIRRRVDKDQRVLVTTLTKRMAEDLTDYLIENGFKVRYLHSEVDTLERIQIVRDLRLGEFDVLVGINLLREGLDLPEVTLVAILDADKEGFLRGQTSLIQTIGRAARNVDGTVIMYADKMTAAMEVAIGETDRRRARQTAYNEEHGITPRQRRQGRQRHLHDAERRGGGAHQGPPRRQGRGQEGRDAARRPREAAHQPRGRDVRGGGPAQVRVRRQAARRDQGAQQGARPERRSSWLTPCICSGSSPTPRTSARHARRRCRRPRWSSTSASTSSAVCRSARATATTSCARRSVMAAAETRDVLRKYDDALVVQLDIPLTQDCVDEQLDGKTHAEARSDGAQLEGLRESQNAFAHLMTDLERAAFKLGYRYAAAFSGGECVLCDECVGQASGEQCRHPFEARPSMEAVGIDVVATAEAAGLSVELPAEEHPSWTGLLLID